MSVCALSGLLPAPDCPLTRLEWFLDGTQPAQADTWHVRQRVDAATGQLAAADTPAERIVTRLGLRLPPELREWARDEGWQLALDPEDGQADGDSVAGPTPGPAPGLGGALALVRPDAGAVYRLSSELPREVQRVPIEARVDLDGLTAVEIWLDGSARIATLTEAPYRAFWVLEAGRHTFVARAILRDGTSRDSPPVVIQVLE
jgi:hypothetical protein